MYVSCVVTNKISLLSLQQSEFLSSIEFGKNYKNRLTGYLMNK